MLSTSEIQEVLRQVDRGNRDAFRMIVRGYSLPLRSFIASQVHHLEDVDDLTQEVFLGAYRNLGEFRRGDDFGAWLRGIARNQLLTYFRSSGRRRKAMERFREDVARLVQGDLEQAVLGETDEAVEALLRCVGRLPEKLRRVVRAGLDGDKPAVVAKELLTTVGAVYNLHYRANRLLRDCLQKERDQP